MRASILAAVAATALIGVAFAGAASAQTRIQPGQTLRGELAASDPRMGDQSAYDCFSLATNAGQTYTVTQRSSVIDAYMAVTPTNDCRAMPRTGESNDDGPNMGTDAQLVFQGTGQPWIIRANSYEGNQFGAYTVEVTASGSAAPTRAPGKPPVGGAAPAPAPAQSDENSVYEYLSLCMAADIVETQQGVRETPTREAESIQIFELLMLAGAEANQSEDQITDMVAGLAAAWMEDAAMLRESPPATIRRDCLQMINDS